MGNDAQEAQAHVDDTERPPKRQRESLWQREAEEPRLPASAQSFQEPRLSASAQSFQDWGALAARAKHGPPPSRPPIGLHLSKGLFDALNLEQAQPTLPRGKRWSLARLVEFQQAMFPSRRSKDCKLESPDGKNDSGCSVASAFAARRSWESVCQCGSSESELPEEVPRCGSLTSGSGDDGAESVGSTSSVADSAIERRVGAKLTGSSLARGNGGSALDGQTCDLPCPLCGGECTGHRMFPDDACCTCEAQHEWTGPWIGPPR